MRSKEPQRRRATLAVQRALTSIIVNQFDKVYKEREACLLFFPEEPPHVEKWTGVSDPAELNIWTGLGGATAAHGAMRLIVLSAQRADESEALEGDGPDRDLSTPDHGRTV